MTMPRQQNFKYVAKFKHLETKVTNQTIQFRIKGLHDCVIKTQGSDYTNLDVYLLGNMGVKLGLSPQVHKYRVRVPEKEAVGKKINVRERGSSRRMSFVRHTLR
jgi:hypothetical protein